MEIYRDVCVIKQISEGFSVNGKSLSGILRIECEQGVCTLFLSLINVLAVSEGEYYLVFVDGSKKTSMFNLKNRPSSFNVSFESLPDLESYSVGIVYLKDDIPTLIGFSNKDGKISITNMRKIVAEKCLHFHKEHLERLKEEYDDEAVATVNYYSFDKIKGEQNENVPYENDEFGVNCQKGAGEKKERDCECKNERDYHEQEIYGENNPYFGKAKKELDEIFFRFNKEENLMRLFPDSNWAKIYYSGEKYYVVGIIREENKEKYICYGVPSVYSKTPPKELDGYCSFVPISLLDMKGKGYWMMFQDAISGKCIKK